MAGPLNLATPGQTGGKTLVASGTALASPDPEKAALNVAIYGSNGAVISSTNPVQTNLATLIAGEPGSGSQLAVNIEGIKATYHLAGFVTPAATPTDVIQLQGSGTKTVRVLYIAISVESTASGVADVLLIRRSTASSGGSSTSPTIGRSATADPAATAAVLVWTANPAGLGTLVSNLGAKKVAGTTYPLAEWKFGANNDKEIVLSGTSDYLCINGNGDTLLTAEAWAYHIIFTEE